MVLFILFISLMSCQDNDIKFSVIPEKDITDQPMCISLDDIGQDLSGLVLYRLEGKSLVKIASQQEGGAEPKLWFYPGIDLGKGQEVRFVLKKAGDLSGDDDFTAEQGAEYITLSAHGKEIFRYRHAMMEAPEGTDPLYRRKGAFIHPLYSPSGKVLTRIQPPDHYHHYGIWNPWTKTFFEGRQVDFWNLAAGQGTVRYKRTLSTSSGDLFTGFKVFHEHIDFSAGGGEKIAMNEIWDVRAYEIRINEQPAWMIDFVFTLSCATDSAIELAQYRYGGGIGFRATEAWTNKNSNVLTSEGKTRANADATKARWCMLSGETAPGQTSGLVFMSHPENRAHPEPMRVWPEDAADGRGDLFFEFCPIRHEGWKLYPGKEYVLKYRLLVYEGGMEAETADNFWDDYTEPLKVELFISE
jgi:hypothetical protein